MSKVSCQSAVIWKIDIELKTKTLILVFLDLLFRLFTTVLPPGHSWLSRREAYVLMCLGSSRGQRRKTPDQQDLVSLVIMYRTLPYIETQNPVYVDLFYSPLALLTHNYICACSWSVHSELSISWSTPGEVFMLAFVLGWIHIKLLAFQQYHVSNISFSFTGGVYCHKPPTRPHCYIVVMKSFVKK